MTAQTQQHSTWLAAQQADISTTDLWAHYYANCGNVEIFEIDAYLHGMYELPQSERNSIALALNELIDDLPGHLTAEYVHDPALR